MSKASPLAHRLPTVKRVLPEDSLSPDVKAAALTQLNNVAFLGEDVRSKHVVYITCNWVDHKLVVWNMSFEDSDVVLGRIQADVKLKEMRLKHNLLAVADNQRNEIHFNDLNEYLQELAFDYDPTVCPCTQVRYTVREVCKWSYTSTRERFRYVDVVVGGLHGGAEKFTLELPNAEAFRLADTMNAKHSFVHATQE